LPTGETFDARKEKKGVTVYYLDDKGKVRSQLYTLAAGETKGKPAAAAAPASPMPVTVAPSQNTVPASTQRTAQEPTVTAAASAQRETVKCSFSSTPAGAEVTVDGRYVGSTPSVLGLTTGTHVVAVSMTGFAQWKRELTVTAGSELTVNAVLEKAQ